MPPPRREGSIEKCKRATGAKYYRARIWLSDGTRARCEVPEKYSYSEERAKLYANALQEREDETGEMLTERRKAEADEARESRFGGETCSSYRKRLDAHRKELGRRSGKDDRSTWRAWIHPVLGGLPIMRVTRDDVERLRDKLDDAISLHKRTEGKEGIGSKRARNVWNVVTTTFKAAQQSKRRELRVRDDNPCTDVLPPERGESRKRTFVYPNEMNSLSSHAPPCRSSGESCTL